MSQENPNAGENERNENSGRNPEGNTGEETSIEIYEGASGESSSQLARREGRVGDATLAVNEAYGSGGAVSIEAIQGTQGAGESEAKKPAEKKEGEEGEGGEKKDEEKKEGDGKKKPEQKKDGGDKKKGGGGGGPSGKGPEKKGGDDKDKKDGWFKKVAKSPWTFFKWALGYGEGDKDGIWGWLKN